MARIQTVLLLRFHQLAGNQEPGGVHPFHKALEASSTFISLILWSHVTSGIG